MKIKLILIGKTSKSYFIEAEKEYMNRLKNYCQFERIEIPDIKNAASLSEGEIKKKEGALILDKLKNNEIVVLLDENGKQRHSVEFSEWLQNKMNYESRDIVFVIGGAYGFSDEVYSRSDEKFALSKMTFSHQMVRTIFLEQLYRAFTILRNEPYHHR